MVQWRALDLPLRHSLPQLLVPMLLQLLQLLLAVLLLQ